MLQDVRKICHDITERLEQVHVRCFSGMDKPLVLISDTYPGIWLEHVYDSVIYAALQPGALELAENTVNLFMDYQTKEGQLPCYVWDAAKIRNSSWESGDLLTDCVGYCQLQECVSFAQLCLEVSEMAGDSALLAKSYHSAKNWENWLRGKRMTTGKGLVEMFVGFDTGHDNSARIADLAHPGNHVINGVPVNAACLPEEDGISPVLPVDINANFYATECALAAMAKKLGKPEEALEWEARAKEVKENLFAHCFDEKDVYFYDVDKTGKKRKYRSSTIFHLFQERVLDREKDASLIEQLYFRYMKDPEEFWTPYPFPSMSVSDPSFKKHAGSNCWGYFSQALTALRCTRWMDHYGMQKDFDILCGKWIEAWTACYDTMKLGQELDPFTGKPSASSEWYSSCMLFYLYAAKRLELVTL